MRDIRSEPTHYPEDPVVGYRARNWVWWEHPDPTAAHSFRLGRPRKPGWYVCVLDKACRQVAEHVTADDLAASVWRECDLREEARR